MSPVKSVLPPHFLSKILLHGVNWGGAFQVPGSEAHKDGLCGLRMGGAQAWGSSEGAGLRRGVQRQAPGARAGLSGWMWEEGTNLVQRECVRSQGGDGLGMTGAGGSDSRRRGRGWFLESQKA